MFQTNRLDRLAILDALEHLGNIEMQRQLWLSDGSSGLWSSFTEAVEQLFTDTGLSLTLEKDGSGFGIEADNLFGELSMASRKVNDSRGPDRTIDDPAMNEVRVLASRLHNLLASQRAEDLS